MISFLNAHVPGTDISKLDQLIDRLIDMGVSAGKSLLIALIVFVVGRFIVRLLNKLVARMLDRPNIDDSVQTFLKSFVNILLMILLGVSVISTLGINTTSIAALLASAGVAIGMALSGNLQNFAGGLIILVFKPYRVGDWIEAQNVQGSVTEIQIFHTVVRTADNKVIFIPNGSMSSAVVINYSMLPTRRLQWTIGIDYGEDVERAKSVVLDILNADSRVMTDPEPFVAVGELAASSVNLVVRVWVKQEDYWDVYHEMFQNIYRTFNSEGIDFPFPQQTVHLVKDEKE